MSTATVIERPLPHGSVPYHMIGDMQVREAVMKLNENILALKRQVVELQKAVQELQRR